MSECLCLQGKPCVCPCHHTDAAAVRGGKNHAGDDTLGQQLYIELDGHGWDRPGERCVCGWDPGETDEPMDRHLADALLPLIREHVAAAVQAERERLQALVADAVRAALDGSEATDG